MSAQVHDHLIDLTGSNGQHKDEMQLNANGYAAMFTSECAVLAYSRFTSSWVTFCRRMATPAARTRSSRKGIKRFISQITVSKQ